MALIGFYHVMSYKGMPDFLVANDTANRATTFWIIARLIGGFGILVSIAMPKVKVETKQDFIYNYSNPHQPSYFEYCYLLSMADSSDVH